MFHMCASVWMCECPTCQCFRYGANSEEAGSCGRQWMTQEAEGAFVSSLLWSLPAVTALCCVLYEGPEKMGFPGLAQVRLRMCHRQWYYYREPCRGKWQASNGGPCLMHSHYRQGGSLFFSHATDLSSREATSWVRELIPGFSTAPRDTRILSQKSGAKGAVWQWRVVELGSLCAWACRKRLPGELWHKFKIQLAW